MHVRRGTDASPAGDADATARLADVVAETGEPGVRVWYPPAHVAFGRRDRRAPGYERARRAAVERGYPPTERETGGRAVAFTGGVLGAVRIEPVDAADPAIDSRYERLLGDLETAFGRLDVETTRGEPPDAFCPGTHSLSADGKLAGLAQRVGDGVSIAAAVVIVDDAQAVRSVLAPVYEALGVSFDPASVGCLAAAGCEADGDAVRDTVETALVGDAAPTVRDT